jgi:hypothetical protein
MRRILSRLAPSDPWFYVGIVTGLVLFAIAFAFSLKV